MCPLLSILRQWNVSNKQKHSDYTDEVSVTRKRKRPRKITHYGIPLPLTSTQLQNSLEIAIATITDRFDQNDVKSLTLSMIPGLVGKFRINEKITSIT